MSNKCRFRFKNTSARLILITNHNMDRYEDEAITGITLNKDYLIITKNYGTKIVKEKIAIETINEFQVYRLFGTEHLYEYGYCTLLYCYRKQGV